MTVRQAFEKVLIELNKVQAPSLLLDDFVYLFNKAIQKYINKRYNLFEQNQQLTDDLRVLLRTVKLDEKNNSLQNIRDNATTTLQTEAENIFDDSYLCTLPNDYMHILNCICTFQKKDLKCKDCGIVKAGANKLATNEWPHVIENFYMRPSVNRPYYYISNLNDPTISSPVDYAGGSRYGNASIPTMQIKCGNDRKRYNLQAVFIDYLRAPKYVTLDQEDLDSDVDTTDILEFPDYVVYEIINELVTLILENGKDPRISTFIQTSPSILPPPQSRQ